MHNPAVLFSLLALTVGKWKTWYMPTVFLKGEPSREDQRMPVTTKIEAVRVFEFSSSLPSFTAEQQL